LLLADDQLVAVVEAPAVRKRDVAIIGGVIVIIALAFALLEGFEMMEPRIMEPGMVGAGGLGENPFWSIFALLSALLVVVGIALIVVWLLRQGRRAKA
jgi:hypothetical protein